MEISESRSINQDGSQQTNAMEVLPPSKEDKNMPVMSTGGDTVIKKKKTRRKRKVNKPYMKIPWQQRRNPIMKNKIYRNRKIMNQAKTHAPYNTNQFLMEVHMPESEGIFQIPRAPSARTRDSSFSVDSEENYFYSLPEDEEEFLTKEFSSVYEDAHSERLSNMTKTELMQEYLHLESKVESLTKRLISRSTATNESDLDTDMSTAEAERESRCMEDLRLKLKEQEDRIRELQASNESLRLQNERLQQCSSNSTSSSADSESDSSSSSSSSSSQGSFEVGNVCPNADPPLVNGYSNGTSPPPVMNGHSDCEETVNITEAVNGNGNGDHSSEMGLSPLSDEAHN